VNGSATHYTLDLAGGLTQVLSDGESVVLYGRGRLAQKYLSAGETAVQYFLGDALSSVRQLTDDSEIILTKRYRPFGETMESAGDGTTAYAFTGQYSVSIHKMELLETRYRHQDNSHPTFNTTP